MSSITVGTLNVSEHLQLPVLSQNQINAISNPVEGQIAYNTDANFIQVYVNGQWLTTQVGKGNELFEFTDHLFTNQNRTGATGPAVPGTLYSTSWSGNSEFFAQGSFNGIQRFTIPADGTYEITAAGARGGGSQRRSGGYGYKVSARFDLVQGEKLDIVVGQIGDYNAQNGGGGGGSFVWKAGQRSSAPLIVAGGGGGAGYNSNNGYDAGTGEAGGNVGPCGNNGGTGGNAGGNTYNNGMGGGGWIQYGDGGAGTVDNFIGKTQAPGGPGGFGLGGGGTNGDNGAGGGGGYSGGAGGCDGGNGWGGGGGGTYVAGTGTSRNNRGTNTGNEGGTSAGNGWVKIEKIV